jgi:hypothetical protein
MRKRIPEKPKSPAHASMVRIPIDFRGDYAEAIDQSTALGATVAVRTDALVDEIGGGRHVGIVKRTLCRNFTIVGILIEGVASGISDLKPVDIGALSQLMNSQIGLARILGTEVRAEKVSTIAEWKARAANAQRAPVPVEPLSTEPVEPVEANG